MKIGIPKERRPLERRVAVSPETVKKFTGLGAKVVVETGAGTSCGLTDELFQAAGAEIASDAAGAVGDADLVLKVRRPMTAADGTDEAAMLKSGAVLVAGLDAVQNADQVRDYASRGIVAFAMELMPRITRAQSMDILSSQSNLAGYKAVLDANEYFPRAMPMMMTAAGTVAPARVFIFGAGVAGLQAIATARRLGAIVSATDVRPATREQVMSLGAKFVAPDIEESGDGEGGYAREMSDAYKARQAEMTAKALEKTDIAITTALIPGRKAPILITADHVKSMRAGSVIVDLAAEMGGNCELSTPGEVTVEHGVTIVAHLNVASRVAADASQLFAKNLWNFLSPHFDKDSGELKIDWADETVTGTLLTRDGQVVHPQLKGEG
ncbi:MAG: Re/Si-specific NAD(P)(+) transhydrogenase subunit alpha [Minwuia sp.]|nr:Re/Si-specific NAD(P)(+) transhydrogenase subunit alpha [Minwuia sp.]